jgi:hypothetical protein
MKVVTLLQHTPCCCCCCCAFGCCFGFQVLFAERAKGKQPDLQLPYVDKERARQREEKSLQVRRRLKTVSNSVPVLLLEVSRDAAESKHGKKMQTRRIMCRQQHAQGLHSQPAPSCCAM